MVTPQRLTPAELLQIAESIEYRAACSREADELRAHAAYLEWVHVHRLCVDAGCESSILRERKA